MMNEDRLGASYDKHHGGKPERTDKILGGKITAVQCRQQQQQQYLIPACSSSSNICFIFVGISAISKATGHAGSCRAGHRMPPRRLAAGPTRGNPFRAHCGNPVPAGRAPRWVAAGPAARLRGGSGHVSPAAGCRQCQGVSFVYLRRRGSLLSILFGRGSFWTKIHKK
jgi:hypothetical protein